jgi:broad specificity phosphatase PhoE
MQENKMIRLIFVRHGQTVSNANQIICGQHHGRLSKLGVAQAKLVAKRLRDADIDVIYSSDLRRARQTAREIQRYHDVDIRYDKRLREKNFGIFDGKSLKYLVAAEELTGRDYIFFKPKGGESYKEIIKRASSFFKEIIPKNKGKTVLIVSHHNFITLSLILLLNDDIKNHARYSHKNTGVTILEISGKNAKLIKLNCTKHLSR